jgi:hypothetical protein
MAIFNEIHSGRFNRALQKIFVIKGSPPVRQLAGEVVPAVQLFYGAENRYLEGWNRFAWSFQNGPSAAQTNGMRLRNPATSNLVAVLEKVSFFSTNSAMSIILSAGDNNPDLETIAAVSPMPLDNRQGPAGTHTSNLIASTGALSPPVQRVLFQGNSGVGAWVITDVVMDENQEIPILPGRSVTLQQTTVNTTLIGNYIWRERLLEESERT